ncbi:MAG: hypothetical protein E7178_01755 [Erysipelotrichaceae bacterium]|nr:hypothetical protein [Erysipelotrichaceae bacterium]
MDSLESKIITISNEYKAMYIFCFLLLLLNIYISINYLLQRVDFKKHFIWISSLIIAIGLFMILYSYIAEIETYKLFFKNITETTRTYNPKSLTNNTNSYATIMLGAGFCCYGLHIAIKKHIFWILGLFFCINTIFPMSRACLFLAIILTIGFFVYKMIKSWKQHTFRNMNFVFLLVLSICIFISMCLTIPELKNYIKDVLFTNNSSIKDRKLLWDIAITMTRDFHRYIGIGHGYFNTAFATIIEGSVKMPHNLYIQTYGALGYLGLSLLAALICFSIYKIIKLYKNNRDASLISVIGLIIVLTYYLVEG